MTKKTNNSNRPRNRVAIFYKSHGEFIGPYCNMTFSQRQINQLRKDGTLSEISNYVLRSPLQLRKRVA